MDHQRAIRSIEDLTKTGSTSVSFVTPVVSVCLAAAKIGYSKGFSVEFSSEATGYAENNGLRYHIGESSNSPSPGASHGRSYCCVEKLFGHEDVDRSNATVGRLLRRQLSNCPNQDLVSATCGVVGELHDNVASHAYGAGFSAAQVYKGSRNSIQIAIADAGCGLRKSLYRVGFDLSDTESIEWCLKRGNTTAATKPSSDLLGPQRGVDKEIPNRPSGNHHMGEGLYRLVELVTNTGGQLWIWTGFGQFSYTKHSTRTIDSKVQWNGTAIEIELPIDAFQRSEVATDENAFEGLARRLNL